MDRYISAEKRFRRWKTGAAHWNLVSAAGQCSPVLAVNPGRRMHTDPAPSSRQLAPQLNALWQRMNAEVTAGMHCMCCAEI